MPRRKNHPSNINTGNEDDNDEVHSDDIDPQLSPNKSQATQPEEKKKSPIYTEPKDYELCCAWVQVSKDPAVGTNQEGSTSWEQILTVYHKAMPHPIRPANSLKKQWSNNVQPAINKFCGCVNQVEQFNQSGASVEDQLNRALRIYTKDQHTHFKHLCCYNLLVKSPKWTDYCCDNKKKAKFSKKKRAASPTSNPPPSNAPKSTAAQNPAPSNAVSKFDGTGTNPSILEQPIGKKRQSYSTKDQEWKVDVADAQNKIASKSEQFKDIMNNDSLSLKRIAQNGERMAQNAETASELSIMNKNLAGLDNKQQEYYRLKRREILQSLREKEKST
ncbi:hypothetical protein PTTG_26561 [Puccinia triticina 1-1 BBBD Race 1]|uniref:NAM-associated domain-containing protein n=1 Tax=Puccinia triticina (isolate 1-1 / race 1 (BBBD)) TaxID=630390 RepID=A0A180GSC0_PUCT1|nr:hypothetical protein PTTG_26561 [Puccinia triticina 1-1 BBBD Race 1]